MSVSRGRRSRESRASPSGRRKASKKLHDVDKKFLRTLLRVLAKVVDERGEFVNDDDSMAVILEESDSESETEKKNDAKGAVAGEKSAQPPIGQAARENGKREMIDERKNITRFQKLHENHGQLTDQIQSSLNALGGGGRTAKALSRMHEEVTRITGLFYVDNEKTYGLDTDASADILGTCSKAALEVAEAFKELGMFNKSFFDTLERITKQLETIAVQLVVEYGSYDYCDVDKYLDSVFEPLIEDFDAFLHGLTNIAEKEIATIRNAQDFSSQRYLNLTTVATFLSSVTATTLQITAGDSGSALTSVANTLWLISLVFSTASAVYSLLVMTWRQSSVCQPNLALPSILNPWFRNGPMYTLIAAVMTFSIGLCLLAFHVALQQGGLASAIVPTAFAGLHAYAIFLFSAWFLWEQWKSKHKESWDQVRDGYLTPLAKKVERDVDRLKSHSRRLQESPDNIMKSGRRVLNYLTKPFTYFTSKTPTSRRRVIPPSSGVEERSAEMFPLRLLTYFRTTRLSHFRSRHRELLNPAMSSQFLKPRPYMDKLFSNMIGDDDEQESEWNHGPEAAEPGNEFPVPEAVPLPESDTTTNMTGGDDSDEEMEDRYKLFVNLLQFSPDGSLLASAFMDTVTIYDVANSFGVSSIIRTPDVDQITQIEWNPRFVLYHSDGLDGELLVRSLGGVSMWNTRFSQDSDGYLVGHLKESVSFVKWADIDDSEVTGMIIPGHRLKRTMTTQRPVGFVSATGCTVRLFNEKCEEVRSIDISKMRKVNRVNLAAFYRKKYVICLAGVPDDTRYDSLLVVNWKEGSVDRFDFEISSLQYALKGNQCTKRAPDVSWTHVDDYIFGSQEDHASWQRVDVADMLTSESDGDFRMSIGSEGALWGGTYIRQELIRPEAAVTFHGKNDRLIIGYSSGEIIVLYEKPDDDMLSAMHIFTVITPEAVPQSPVSFTVNRGSNSKPYMFAFGDKKGSITVWSIQSNAGLAKSEKAGILEVHDRRGSRLEKPIITTGRFLILQPQRIHEEDDANPLSIASR